MAGRLISLGPDRYRLVQNSEINVTPFVDIMLVLLIVFMVAMPMATVSLKLDLPPADGAAVGPPPTVVSLQKGGALFIGESPTSLDRLSGELARRIGGANPRAQRVYVRAERGVRYGDFVGLVSRLHQDGFHAVGLVNEAL
jgi:biopolymer transport protein ExbD